MVPFSAITTLLKFGRLQFTGNEYKAIKTASQDLAKLSNNIADKVKVLGKRQTPAIITEGQKLLSCTELTKIELIKSQKPCYQPAYIFNILNILASEQPLCNSSNFRNFLAAFLILYSKLDKLLKLHP
ncbi:hypothetical protein BDW62DRAFT_214880 [Aspergillus aurantiobrunneus]